MFNYKTFQDIHDFFQQEFNLAKSNLEKAKKSEALNFTGFIEPNENVFKFYEEVDNSYIEALFYEDIENEEELLKEAIDWLAEASKDLVKFNRFCLEAKENGDLKEAMIKLLDILNEVLEEKDDRCLRIARRKFDKPSAYRSGAIVRCRKGKIWKGLKEELDQLDEKQKETLRTWFKRKGAPGKTGGWVDCNTCREVDSKTKCKPCGRQKGEKRAKYPSCRPTPSQCKQPGKGKKWGKTK
jgi:hypothetical protein